jgi:hypothetical protein
LIKQFLVSLTVVTGDLIMFCNAVERLLSSWHERTRLQGRDLQELKQVTAKLRADIEELMQVMEQWNSHEGDSGAH